MEDEEPNLSVPLIGRGAVYGKVPGAKEAAWLIAHWPTEDLGLDLWSPMVILGDNQSTLALTQNPVFHPHPKHIAIQYHFTRELV